MVEPVINILDSNGGAPLHALLAGGALGASLIFLVCLQCAELLCNVGNVLPKSASKLFLPLCYFAAPMGM